MQHNRAIVLTIYKRYLSESIKHCLMVRSKCQFKYDAIFSPCSLNVYHILLHGVHRIIIQHFKKVCHSELVDHACLHTYLNRQIQDTIRTYIIYLFNRKYLLLMGGSISFTHAFNKYTCCSPVCILFLFK